MKLTNAEKKNTKMVRAKAMRELENKNDRQYTSGILDQQKRSCEIIK